MKSSDEINHRSEVMMDMVKCLVMSEIFNSPDQSRQTLGANLIREIADHVENKDFTPRIMMDMMNKLEAYHRAALMQMEQIQP